MTHHRATSGFSLLQVLMAIAVLGVLAGMFAEMTVVLQKEVRRLGGRQGRILTSYQIDQIAMSPFGIKTSAGLSPLNDKLRVCVQGGTLPGCSSNCCTHGVKADFYLLDPRDTNPDFSARARLSGPATDPVFYDETGNNKCVGLACVYRVSSSFVPQCPGGVASCEHAEHLTVTLSVDPLEGKEYLMKSRTKNLIYFVSLNYQPFLTPVSNVTMAVGESRTISVYGNTGHPSEVQNFIFEKCQASNGAAAQVTCYGFLNGVGTLKLDGVAVGLSTITLQINDGGTENNLSNDLTFNVQVN